MKDIKVTLELCDRDVNIWVSDDSCSIRDVKLHEQDYEDIEAFIKDGLSYGEIVSLQFISYSDDPIPVALEWEIVS